MTRTISQFLVILGVPAVVLSLAAGCEGGGASSGQQLFGGAAGAAGAVEGSGGLSSGSGGAETGGVEGGSGGSGGGGSSGGGSSGGPMGVGGGDCVDDETCACHGADECPPTDGCAAGEGLFSSTGECFRCSPAISCDGSGETGLVLATSATDGASCICETKDGYFPGSEGGIAEVCDADRDGWVTDRAQPSVESDDEVIRRNARCDVRRVNSFYLVNEAGKVFNTALDDDLTVDFPGDEHVPAGLPLYENAGNDADPEGKLPYFREPGQGRRLFPREVNSLTKACLGINTDANQNGVPDVSEWSGSGAGRSFANDQLERYYQKYTEYSYFLTLHDGFWDDSGVYRIVERRRTAAAAVDSVYDVPLTYTGAPEYAMTCERHADAFFPWSSSDEMVPNTVTVGGDFVRFSEAAMFHHSQFKCVQVTSNYGSNTAEERPELLLLESGQLKRREESKMVTLGWTLNDCEATESAADDSGKNPAFPKVECVVSAPKADTVRWAAVPYEHYTAPHHSVDQSGGYVRGCINECADRNAHGGNECVGCSASSWGEAVNLGPETVCGEDRDESCDGFGLCSGCASGYKQCQGNALQVCGQDQQWDDSVPCPHGCGGELGDAFCYPECAPHEVGCSAEGVPRTCQSSGQWEELAACSGEAECVGGKCLVPNGKPCSQASECASGFCKDYFQDSDGDGYGGQAVKLCGASPPGGYTTQGGDCCDDDEPRAHPGQTEFFDAPTKCGDYDFDCDDEETKKWPTPHQCTCMNKPAGWIDGVPDCGETGEFGVCGYPGVSVCQAFPTNSDQTQACR